MRSPVLPLELLLPGTGANVTDGEARPATAPGPDDAPAPALDVPRRALLARDADAEEPLTPADPGDRGARRTAGAAKVAAEASAEPAPTCSGGRAGVAAAVVADEVAEGIAPAPLLDGTVLAGRDGERAAFQRSVSGAWPGPALATARAAAAAAIAASVSSAPRVEAVLLLSAGFAKGCCPRGTSASTAPATACVGLSAGNL